MIGSIRHKALRRLFEERNAKGLSPELVPRLRRVMSALHGTDNLEQLQSVPGWRLHALKGDLNGYWSLSVSGNWRMVFQWRDGVATELDLLDYH